jgi:lactate permease
MGKTAIQFLSFLPIICLIVFSLVRNINIAAIISFVVTSVLFFIWNSSFYEYAATLIASFLSTLNILMIVFGALYLYSAMENSGRIHQIRNSLKEVHPSNDILFFFISLGMTGFFEGVAGFGTPGAIVPPILISMGYNPIASVVTVLLFDGLFAAFGAVGTPLIVGMEQPLQLSELEIKGIGIYSSCMIGLAGIVFLFFIFIMYRKIHGKIKNSFKIIFLRLSYCIYFLLYRLSFFPGMPRTFQPFSLLSS